MLDKPPAPESTAPVNPIGHGEPGSPRQQQQQQQGRGLLSLLPSCCSAFLLLLPHNLHCTGFLGSTRSPTSLWSCQLPGYGKRSRAGRKGGLPASTSKMFKRVQITLSPNINGAATAGSCGLLIKCPHVKTDPGLKVGVTSPSFTW